MRSDVEKAEPTASALSGRGILNATLIVMIFFVLSRATGLLREVVIGARFGTGAELDAYLAGFRIPDILFQLVAGGALGSAFIPTFSSYRARGDDEGAWLLFSRVLNLITLVLVIVAGLAALFAEPIVTRLIAPGFPVEQQALTARLMRWMLLSTVVFGASGLVMGALNAVQHFLLPAAAPVLYNLAIIAGAWLLAPRFGIYGLVTGVVVGALAHLLIQIPALIRKKARYSAQLTVYDPGVREVGRLMGPRILGLLFVQMHFLVNTILASGLAAGSLSALNYAWLIMLLPQGVFAQAVATAAFPTFAAQVAADQQDKMGQTLGHILRMILFTTIPSAVILALFGTPLIRLLLERGEFSGESTYLVTVALQFYAVGLVGHAIVEIAVRAFYALHDTLTPVAVGIAAMVLNILFSLWWVRTLGFGGLALANSIATLLEMIVLLSLLARRIPDFARQRLLRAAGRSALSAAIMGMAILGFTRLWTEPLQWPATLGVLAASGAIYLSSAYFLKSEELQPAIALVLKRFNLT